MGASRTRVSASGITHVVSRGVGHQLFFEDDIDRKSFMNRLERVFEDEGLDLLAWVLMGNHVHLLILDERNQLSAGIHRLLSGYAHDFNKRHDRDGHVFQSRFDSRPVESDDYLLEVVRYIHQNPQVAGMASLDEYEWSSYGEYIGNSEHSYSDTKLVKGLFGSREAFIEYMSASPQTPYIAPGPRKHLSDEELIRNAEIILTEVGSIRPCDVKALSKDTRNLCVRLLAGGGFSVSEIVRLTGLSKSTIVRIGKAA